MALKAGMQAPDFTLKHKQGSEVTDVTLSEQLGERPAVLLFFPLAFSSVCTKELCDVSAGLGAYEELDAAVYGISVDAPHTLEAFAKAEAIRVPLLSDFNKRASRAYDVLYEVFAPGKLDLEGVAKRSAFVIGKEGIIKYSTSSDDPTVLPDFEAVQAALKG